MKKVLRAIEATLFACMAMVTGIFMGSFMSINDLPTKVGDSNELMMIDKIYSSIINHEMISFKIIVALSIALLVIMFVKHLMVEKVES